MRAQPESRFSLEVPVDRGVDTTGRITVGEFNPDAHPIRQWWSNHTVENGTLAERIPLEPELLEPGPPLLELIDLLYDTPQFVRSLAEFVLAAVPDDRPSRHAATR